MENRIKVLRKARGISQQRLAEMIGTSKPPMGRLENGRRRLSDHWIARIAAALQVRPGELLHEVPQELDTKAEALVELFAQLPEAQKDALIHLAESMAKPYATREAGDPKSRKAAGEN